MSKIILASQSPQRKKLLKQYGLSFVTKPANVDEVDQIQTTCAALVKHNSLLKAQHVASQVKSGIVIGSDTVVYLGNKKIATKPKNLKEAKRVLKCMMKTPQSVYSGIALVDAKTGEQIVDYDKTKVFMAKLTDNEIDRYHKKVPPFDKAGGFDIEGWGGLFIYRIEGCYSNVIGMPMAKLFQNLKKMGVSLLSMAICFILVGCTTEYNLATKQQESLLHSEEKEIKIGDSVAEKIAKKFDFVEEVDANERVQKILDKIVEVSDRKTIPYFIRIIDDDPLNAVSLPGGYVYVFKGLLDKIENDDQLAGVIAHEVAHIAARHGVKRLQSYYGAMLLQAAAMEATNSQFASGVGFAITSLFMEYSQDAEHEADALSVEYLKRAGYDPKEMLGFLHILHEENQKSPRRQYSYWRTHPHIKQRIAVVNTIISGSINFKDYLNLVGEK